jgi:NitT/TauT family transport system substrate-binding protein
VKRSPGFSIALILGVLAVTPAGVALPAAAQSTKPVTLKVLTIIPYLSYLPFYLAMDKGLYREEKLEIEHIEFRGGGDTGRAFIGGAGDLMIASLDHVLKFRSQGRDVVAIGGMEVMNSYVLMAKKGTPYTSLASLKGRKIGITSPGGQADLTLRFSLKEAGIEPGRDVELVVVGGGAAGKAALDHGQVDAMMLFDPLLTALLQQPDKYQAVEDWRKQEYMSLAVIAKREWLTPNKEVAKRFMAVTVKAMKLVQNPEVALEAAKTRFKELDSAVLKGAVEGLLPRLSRDGTIPRQAVKNIVDGQVFAGIVPKALPYEEMVDLSLLPQ